MTSFQGGTYWFHSLSSYHRIPPISNSTFSGYVWIRCLLPLGFADKAHLCAPPTHPSCWPQMHREKEGGLVDQWDALGTPCTLPLGGPTQTDSDRVQLRCLVPLQVHLCLTQMDSSKGTCSGEDEDKPFIELYSRIL